MKNKIILLVCSEKCDECTGSAKNCTKCKKDRNLPNCDCKDGFEEKG